MLSRFESPFIFKVKFYDQSKGNKAEVNAQKNASHIEYIGTRPGVDKGEISLSEQEIEGMFELTDKEFKDLYGQDRHSPDTAAGHVKYADERPGSHGLFDSTGNTPSMKQVQNELSNYKGVVWRMILSLKEEDALKLGYTERDKWEETLRAKVTDAAKAMGIKESNLRWVAAFHQEKGHPHVHLVVWEKEPERTKGLLSIGEKKDVKRAFMKEIYAGEKARLYQEKTAERDLIRDLAKGDAQKAVSIIKELKVMGKDIELELRSVGHVKTGIAPKLFSEDHKEIVKQITELSRVMPTRGRMAFKYMPEEVKVKSLEIADSMLGRISFQESLSKYFKAVEEMTALHTKNPELIEQARKNAYGELQQRIAQLVIQGAGEVNKRYAFEVNPKLANKVIKMIGQAKTDNNISEQDLKALSRNFSRVLVASGIDRETSIALLKQWNQKSNLSLKDEEIEKVVDKALKHQNELRGWSREVVVGKTEWKDMFQKLGVKEPEWMWKPSNNPTLDVAKSFWKATFQAIEQEQMQGQAQAELQRRQAEQQQRARQRQLQREMERER